MPYQIVSSELPITSPAQGAYWGYTAHAGAGVGVPELALAVQAARMGDENACNTLIEHYRTAADRLAQQILRNEEAAADAVQEALIKAYRAMPRFQDGNFRSWLLRIVTNTCYDHLRRQKRRSTVSLDDGQEWSAIDMPSSLRHDAENPETVALNREGLRLLLEAVNELPSWHRNVVILVDVHGYDYSEAAEILALPLGTVKSRLSRARAALRDALVAGGLVRQPLQ
jgi:RNA polymerase sigma-70 factor (ECF subfamily)